jgi:hypothetical protein
MRHRRPRQPVRRLELRRAERELFFWTAREALKLVTWLVLAVYFLISIAHGRIAGLQELLDLVQEIPTLLR